MVIQLHDDQRGQVRLNSDLSEPFPIVNGVKQGCVLAPTQFSIFFRMMLKQATENLGSAALRTRCQYEEDRGPPPASTPAHRPPHITIGETELKVVHQFTYLGCTITSDSKIDREVDNRLAKANSAFGRLYKRVWNNKQLKKGTKISVYRAVILTTLLYCSESWVTYRHYLQLLERFHQRCLRTILNIHWSDVTNVEVLEQVEITIIEAMLLKLQLRWAGRVSRMDEHRLPKIALYGHRDRGAPKKRYKDSKSSSVPATLTAVAAAGHACPASVLQSMWTAPFIIFVRGAKP
ncbi:uncharacterized protein LOC119576558 [Penaeus monodon]|uniref:uncharacterized protein LOC119576558 n=1 Tax=Penaeus monodon TaxID=6687 RepID=UPI0018A6F08B|nr:uncharacterized protein LOC119576558 [Penaeus monodon]